MVIGWLNFFSIFVWDETAYLFHPRIFNSIPFCPSIIETEGQKIIERVVSLSIICVFDPFLPTDYLRVKVKGL